MSSSIPTQIAETVQTAHINRNPSPRHDLNPSTAASKKEPVRLEQVALDDGSIDDEEDEDEEDEEDEDETQDQGEGHLYRSRITPRPRRRHQFPPMPDLRFEQSYLSSIRNADTWWKVGWITARDQVSPFRVLMPSR
jgi:hypothetical protein